MGDRLRVAHRPVMEALVAEVDAVRAPVSGPRPVRRGAQRVQTRLQQRRPVAVRRHAARTLSRVFVVLGWDLVAVGAAVSIVTVFARADLPLIGAVVARVQNAMSGGFLGAGYFVAAMLVGLLVTGNYGRRMGARPPASVLRGSAFAVALAFWVQLLDAGPGEIVVPFLMTLAAVWGSVLAARRISDRFLADVWPGAQGAPPAVLLRVPGASDDVPSEGMDALLREYRIVSEFHLRADHRSAAAALLDGLASEIDASGVETIIVNGALPDDQLAAVLDVSLTAGCELLYPARAVQFAGVRPKLVWRDDEPFLELGAPVLKARELLLKRAVDVVGAVLGLVLAAPLCLLIAIAIKVDSPGPAFFTQDRAGLGGRRFRMLKFRTMRAGADDEKDAFAHLNCTGDARLFKIPNDPRVTRLGAWLRRWSLDELPQLWNVLLGDMSLVGPRPFFESDLEAYEDHHFRRLSAKPGITGLWQVNGRSTVVNFEEVVRLDRQYIEQWSLWLDFRIIVRTLPVVFRRTGAY